MEANARKEFYDPFKIQFWIMRILGFFICCLLLFSCRKEKDTDIQTIENGRSRVVILNEGNFRSANASIDVYYPDNHELQDNIFYSNNDFRPLGDVAQSMIKLNGEYWVVINNSNKIEILDPVTFQSKGKMTGFNSPRYVLPISENKAYVSDLYENKIYIVDPLNRNHLSSIDCGSRSEEMLLYDGKAFVCMPDLGKVLVYDVATDSLIRSINTGEFPHAIEIDSKQQIWVAYSGGFNGTFPGLHKIDPLSLEIKKDLRWNDASKSIGDIAMNRERNQIYYVMDDLFVLNIEDSVLASSPLIDNDGRNFYSMATDPNTGDIYLADAIDYQQKGNIYRYSVSGALIHQFKSGLIPGFFYFDQ